MLGPFGVYELYFWPDFSVHVHSPHGDEYALLVQAESACHFSTLLGSLYDAFNSDINQISPLQETEQEGLQRAERDLAAYGKKQIVTALNSVCVPKEERDAILAKYGGDWKLKRLNIRISVSTGVYVPSWGKERNWAKHAGEALEIAKTREDKNGIAVYYEDTGEVLSAADVSSQCLKPSLDEFCASLEQ